MQPPAVGDTHSTTVTFTQRDFDEFARLSGDDNPIHVDPDFSARTAFGRTVAHGMALFGVLDAATARWLDTPMATVSQELMFTAPTFAGETVTVDLAVIARSDDGIEVAQRMTRPDGVQTCVGATRIGPEAAAPSEQRGHRRRAGSHVPWARGGADSRDDPPLHSRRHRRLPRLDRRPQPALPRKRRGRAPTVARRADLVPARSRAARAGDQLAQAALCCSTIRSLPASR